MVDVSKVLKEEITRISRKEAKSGIATIQKENSALKKTVVELQRRIAQLEKEQNRPAPKQPPTAKKREDSAENESGGETGKARITSAQIKSLRKRLGLSQTQLAKLIGVSGGSVVKWESKQGRLQFRGDTLAKILVARKMTKKEAANLLRDQPEQN